MTTCWTSLTAYMPPAVAKALAAVEPRQRETVQEVRLRSGAPLMLSAAEETVSLPVTLTASMIAECFWSLCERAVHTHQGELAHGFVTTREGFRVGVAGTAVIKEGTITSYRDITSLCIRLPRCVDGCAAPLYRWVDDEHGMHSLLLCGAPSTGKTTLLRDLARHLGATRRVCVVDERMELAAEGLPMCDVLRGCPKAVGLMQAVRTLAPDVLIVDELGGEAEWQAVAESVFCGAAVIASAHIPTPRDLALRPFARQLLGAGGFELAAQLPTRGRLQEATILKKAGDFLENSGDPLDRVFLRGSRDGGGMALATSRTAVAGVGTDAHASAWRPVVYGAPHTEPA